MSSGLMFNDTVVNIISNKKLERHNEEDAFFTKIENNNIYMYRFNSIILLEKGTYECLDVPCVHFRIKRKDMKHYLSHIFKSNTSSGDMVEKVDHWLDSFEKFQKKYIIMPSKLLNSYFLEESLFITF